MILRWEPAAPALEIFHHNVKKDRKFQKKAYFRLWTSKSRALLYVFSVN